jgi:hypothetical protein
MMSQVAQEIKILALGGRSVFSMEFEVGSKKNPEKYIYFFSSSMEPDALLTSLKWRIANAVHTDHPALMYLQNARNITINEIYANVLHKEGYNRVDQLAETYVGDRIVANQKVKTKSLKAAKSKSTKTPAKKAPRLAVH